MRKALLIVSVAVFGLSFGGGEQAVSTFTDKRDGKVYRIVEIGGAVWMAENLNYAAEGSKCYDNKTENCDKYGRLYNWEAANIACPAGFYLPSRKEWKALVNYAGGWKNAGKKLMSKAGWNDNGNGTDDYGWSALPGGGYSGGNFAYAGNLGSWWSATATGTEDYADFVQRWFMRWNYEFVYWDSLRKTDLYSVRCVQDSKEGEE